MTDCRVVPYGDFNRVNSYDLGRGSTRFSVDSYGPDVFHPMFSSVRFPDEVTISGVEHRLVRTPNGDLYLPASVAEPTMLQKPQSRKLARIVLAGLTLFASLAGALAYTPDVVHSQTPILPSDFSSYGQPLDCTGNWIQMGDSCLVGLNQLKQLYPDYGGIGPKRSIQLPDNNGTMHSAIGREIIDTNGNKTTIYIARPEDANFVLYPNVGGPDNVVLTPVIPPKPTVVRVPTATPVPRLSATALEYCLKVGGRDKCTIEQIFAAIVSPDIGRFTKNIKRFDMNNLNYVLTIPDIPMTAADFIKRGKGDCDNYTQLHKELFAAAGWELATSRDIGDKQFAPMAVTWGGDSGIIGHSVLAYKPPNSGIMYFDNNNIRGPFPTTDEVVKNVLGLFNRDGNHADVSIRVVENSGYKDLASWSIN